MPSRISLSHTCAVKLVGQQDHDEVAAAGSLHDRQHLQALLARLRDRGGVLAQADNDVHAGVLQVERVRVALRAVADDRDGLAVEEGEVCVVVVDHWAAGYRFDCPAAPIGAGRRLDEASARCALRAGTATSERPGIASEPSCAVYGARASASAVPHLLDLRSGRSSTASWNAREMSSVVSQKSSKLGGATLHVEVSTAPP